MSPPRRSDRCTSECSALHPTGVQCNGQPSKMRCTERRGPCRIPSSWPADLGRNVRRLRQRRNLTLEVAGRAGRGGQGHGHRHRAVPGQPQHRDARPPGRRPRRRRVRPHRGRGRPPGAGQAGRRRPRPCGTASPGARASSSWAPTRPTWSSCGTGRWSRGRPSTAARTRPGPTRSSRSSAGELARHASATRSTGSAVGDSILFDADGEHRYANPGRKANRYVMTVLEPHPDPTLAAARLAGGRGAARRPAGPPATPEAQSARGGGDGVARAAGPR